MRDEFLDRHQPPPPGAGVGRDDYRQPVPDLENEASDSACWAHLICPECGSVLVEGHRPGCPAAVSE